MMDTLPTELLLYLIPFFPLTSLIAVRGISTQWRFLAQTAYLHPARKALLDLYLAAILHPNFPSLVEALRPHVREFDREGYIKDLTSQECILPDIFELWILEWPSNAVHFWAWPGLAEGFTIDHEYYWDRGNSLCEIAATIDTIPVPQREVARVGKTCRGLALWGVNSWAEIGVAQLWLVVDENKKINDRRAGRLLWTHTYYLGGPNETEYPMHTLYDIPFRVGNLIEFLDLLDLHRSCIENTLERYYLRGI